MVVVGLYLIFFWRGMLAARRSKTLFGAVLAFAPTAEIGFQALTNMAVTMALLPTKGLTLPFISFGGSSMVTLGLAVGILLNVSRNQSTPMAFKQLFDARKPTSRDKGKGWAL